MKHEAMIPYSRFQELQAKRNQLIVKHDELRAQRDDFRDLAASLQEELRKTMQLLDDSIELAREVMATNTRLTNELAPVFGIVGLLPPSHCPLCGQLLDVRVLDS